MYFDIDNVSLTHEYIVLKIAIHDSLVGHSKLPMRKGLFNFPSIVERMSNSTTSTLTSFMCEDAPFSGQ